MAVPFRLPYYDEDTVETYLQYQRFFTELYNVLRIFLRQSYALSSELVFFGNLPGVTVRVGIRPSVNDEYAAATPAPAPAPAQPSASESAPLPDLVTTCQSAETKDELNDPEGGTT